MARIPEQILDQVREAHDIVDVVGRAVPLKKAGSGYKGLCPFHDEKTPSFTVHPARQTFKCFGCGKGGNVFTFLVETQGLTFPEAVRQLAEERGIHVPSPRPDDPERDSQVERVRRVLAFAHEFFVRTLLSADGREARAYLKKRGYDEESVRSFRLGYAPAAWDRLILAAGKAGFSGRDLEDAGLAIPRREGSGFYDRFRHRVIFPIADAQGRVVTFAGRTLDPDESAKYLNGPETLLFKKANTLYALDRARDGIRRAGEALLMEGYTDVLMCHLHGFDRAVAGMGTAFTERQATLLRRLAERVVLLYDGDDAGRLAAERALDVLLEEGLEVRIALLPEGRDVDEVLLEEGTEALDAILAGSLELFDFKLELLGRRHDLASPRGRAQAAEALLPSVLRVRSAVERDQLLRTIAERLGGGPETEAVLRRESARLAARSRPGAAPRSERPPEAPGPAAPAVDSRVERIRLESEERAQMDLLAGAIGVADLRPAVFRAIGPEEFTAPARRRLFEAAYRLWERGEAPDEPALLAGFQTDPEVLAILAGLPDSSSDPALAERVSSLIAFLERRRALAHRQREVLRRARGEGSGTSASVDASGVPVDDSGALDPDDSYYGDESFLQDAVFEDGEGTESF